jgi:hypothetical protein
MVKTRAAGRVGIVAALIIATLWYLRDPRWIAGQTTGMWGWEQDADGTRYRWASSHASFFVPSDASEARVRISTTFGERGGEVLLVTVSVDDVRAARVLLTDAAWHDVVIRLPPRGSRRERRIDIRTNGTREDNRAIRIGEARLTPTPR